MHFITRFSPTLTGFRVDSEAYHHCKQCVSATHINFDDKCRDYFEDLENEDATKQHPLEVFSKQKYDSLKQANGKPLRITLRNRHSQTTFLDNCHATPNR